MLQVVLAAPRPTLTVPAENELDELVSVAENSARVAPIVNEATDATPASASHTADRRFVGC